MRATTVLALLGGCNTFLGIAETTIGDAGPDGGAADARADGPAADAREGDAPLPDARPDDAGIPDAAGPDAFFADAAWLGTLVQATNNGGSSISGSFPVVRPLAETFLIYQTTTTATEPDRFCVACYLMDNLDYDCERAMTSLSVAAQLYAVSVPTATVQHLQLGCDGAMTTASLALAVDPTRSFVLPAAVRDGSSIDASDATLVELVDGSTLSLRQTDDACDGDYVERVQVVSLPGARVVRGLVTPTAFPTTQPLAATVDPGRSFLLYSYRLANTTDAEACRLVLRGIFDASNVTFSQGIASECDLNVPEIAYQVVELPPGSTVETHVVDVADGVSSVMVPLARAFDQGRSFALTGGGWTGGQGVGETDGVDLAPGVAQALLGFGDDSTLLLDRRVTDSAARFTVYVVELPH